MLHKKEYLDKLYNYYYMLILYKMINEHGFSYEFKDVYENFYSSSDYRFNEYGCDLINPYLKKYRSKEIELGKDILKNGMYTPFFISNSEHPYMFMGKHRLYSLKLCNKENRLDKKFIFVKSPYSTEKYVYWKKKMLDMNRINNFIDFISYKNMDEIYFDRKLSEFELILELDHLGAYISHNIYFLSEELGEENCIIKPNPILQDEKLFSDFINNPFKEVLIDG